MSVSHREANNENFLRLLSRPYDNGEIPADFSASMKLLTQGFYGQKTLEAQRIG